MRRGRESGEWEEKRKRKTGREEVKRRQGGKKMKRRNAEDTGKVKIRKEYIIVGRERTRRRREERKRGIKAGGERQRGMQRKERREHRKRGRIRMEKGRGVAAAEE